ncbi:MAG: elongation factor P [Clostridiales bacterium]|jgi:elongation factor P|nr:elongation factor P [Clostridiales bacterium]
MGVGFLSAGDVRKGMTFEMDGKVMVIVDFQHVKPGKGAAFVRAKIKNVISGSIVEQTFNPSDKFELAVIERKDMQYLYSDGGLCYFMDPESYEQVPLNESQVENARYFIKENTNATIHFFKGNAFLVEPPNFVELEITECEPGIAGNTATNATKPATLETGLTLNVPMFVNLGDVIRIDTREGGEYMSRV